MKDVQIRGNQITGSLGSIVVSSVANEMVIHGNAFWCCMPGCPEPNTAHVHESAWQDLKRDSNGFYIARVLPDPD